MAVRTNEEIMETLRTRVGEDTSDDALSFIEDVQDTLNSLSNNDNENWKQKSEPTINEIQLEINKLLIEIAELSIIEKR